MRAAPPQTSHVLLTRHFLRQFLENDLIAPDSDRSQLLAVVTATLLCLTLFISAMRSWTYVIAPLLTPGLASIWALDDRLFYLAFGMIVTALVAASQWDALAIDARDAAILEPLPVPAAVIRRAKLSAVAILGAAAAVSINLWPSLVFPSLFAFTFKQVSVVSLLGLIVAHAIFTVAASAFGYLTVGALRETMLAVLGVRWFSRVSPWAQGALIVTLGGSLLVLPTATGGVAQRGLEGWPAMAPPMWFLGAYEMTVGHVVADLPRSTMRPQQALNDAHASALYRERRLEFPALALRAALALGLTLLIAVAAYMWNARRTEALVNLQPSIRRRWPLPRRIVTVLLVRDAAARAGFYFALAAIWRSVTHRLTLASAAAVGVAMAVVALSKSSVASGSASPILLSVQPLLYGALLVGFRHVIRVPAELRANWGFQLAWRDETRAFVTGVKMAGIVALVLPALILVLPLFAYVLGWPAALLHAALGLAGAIVFLEAVTVTYEKVPFTCTYLPSENMKALAPIYLIAFVVGTSIFSRMQYEALLGTGGVRMVLTLALVFAVLRAMSFTRPRLPHVQFDEAPVTFQRLGLDT